MKDIKDYLPYYLGQDCTVIRNDGERVGDILCLSLLQETRIPGKRSYQYYTIIPHLRRLSDMRKEEKQLIGNMSKIYMNHKEHSLPASELSKRWAADQTHYLLKQGFDIFNLIDAGLALDAKTTTP